MGDCRKSGALCTGKIAIPLHTFLKKSSNFLYKLLKKVIDFLKQIPYILIIKGRGSRSRDFKKFPNFLKKVLDFLKTL